MSWQCVPVSFALTVSFVFWFVKSTGRRRGSKRLRRAGSSRRENLREVVSGELRVKRTSLEKYYQEEAMECPVITTNLGKVKGRLSKNLDNDIFYSYLGIPYGKPPIGKQRFKVAEPAEPWEGIKHATKSGEPVVQYPEVFRSDIIGSEDCLWLDIHTKLTGLEEDLKPTIVYLFGSGFLQGNAGHWGPEYILLEDLVIVFFSFRLGLPGFLALRDATLEVPGNASLKDCILALKWVRDNIRNFGGDPKNVTIWGNSSGACMAHLLTLSPSAKGLIHKAIYHSYSAATVDQTDSEVMYTVGPELIKLLGITASNEKEILDILNSVPIEEICAVLRKLQENKGISMTPVVEKANPTAILTKPSIELLKHGDYSHMPLMIGFTNKEGLVYLDFKPHDDKSVQRLYYEYNVCQRISKHMNIEESSEMIKEIEKLLRGYYFDDKKWPEMSDGLAFLLGDLIVLTHVMSAAKHHIKTSNENVYIFRSDFEGGLDYIKNFYNKKSFKGVMHADDLGYMFKYYPAFPDPNFSEIERGSREERAIRIYVKLISNFSRSGNPTPDDELKVQWIPAKDDKEIVILNIGDELKMKKYPEEERMELWKRIFDMSPSTTGFL